MDISIITATYNAAATLSANLDCIRNQTVPVEQILIDGGSTDATLEIARTQGTHLAQVVSEPDQGIYDAMNKGIALAHGEIIGILNADDLYPAADTLAKVAAVFADPTVEACYGDLCYVKGGVSPDEPVKVTRYWKSGAYRPESFYRGWMPPHPTFFVRRSVYERFGTFNLALGTAADYEIMLRFLLKHRIRVAYLPEVLVHMQVGGASNASLKARLAANRNDRKAWTVNGLHPAFWTIPLKPLRKIPQFFCKP